MTVDYMNLINIYRAFYSKAAEYIFFLSAHGIFSRVNENKSTMVPNPCNVTKSIWEQFIAIQS